MQNITFVYFTYNEAHRVTYAIRNAQPYGEVIVLDGGSTDNTQQVVEDLGVKFYLRPQRTKMLVETQENLEFVRAVVKTDWIFWGYVDNIMPKTLLEKLTQVAVDPRYAMAYVPVYTYMWGDTTHPLIKASYTCFFKKDMVDMTNNYIHGMGKFLGTKDQILHLPHRLEYAMRHFSLYDVTKFVASHMKYAEAEAQEKFQNGKRFSVAYLLGSMANYFRLFYSRGWKAGVKGLYVAFLYSFFRLMVAVRLYEIEHNLTLETIEADFVKEKERMIKEIENSANR